MNQKILLVDDDERLLRALDYSLRQEGYVVVKARDGLEALEKMNTDPPDLVILDLMLPRLDGFEVCRRIRSSPQTRDLPVIILSAKQEEVDRVLGFRLGADDYVTKPFSPSELVLRVKAVLRRARAEKEGEEKEVLSFPGLTVDRAGRTVMVGEKRVDLTPKEFELLWLMASHPGRVFSREQIREHIWGTEYITDEEAVNVLVWRLRRRIEEDPENPRFLRTVRGVGYKFEP